MASLVLLASLPILATLCWYLCILYCKHPEHGSSRHLSFKNKYLGTKARDWPTPFVVLGCGGARIVVRRLAVRQAGFDSRIGSPTMEIPLLSSRSEENEVGSTIVIYMLCMSQLINNFKHLINKKAFLPLPPPPQKKNFVPSAFTSVS